jgi:FkbM family methyltransferase
MNQVHPGEAMTVRAQLASHLPVSVKNVLRPVHRLMFPPKVESQVAKAIAVEPVGGFDVAFRKGTADEEVIKHSFDDDIFFPAIPEYVPADGDVIVDIGAHIGTFAILAARRVGNGRVIAAEASRESFDLLRINTALNRCENIAYSHVAVSDKEGTVELFHDVGNWGHSTVKQLSSKSETVAAQPFPAFLESHQVTRCHLLKMNCEGSEFPIILSTPHDVLRRFQRMLVLYHCDLWSQQNEHDLLAHLQASGFTCRIVNQAADRGWIIATQEQGDIPTARH